MRIISTVLVLIMLCDYSLLSQTISKADSVISKNDSSEFFINDYSIFHRQSDNITYFAGEKDNLRLLQLLPGINTYDGKTSEMSIHGFAPHNKMILVDGVEIYYPCHIYNSTSIFHSDIVRSVRLMSNEYPANYGGKLYSVIDISLKEGDKQKYHSYAEVNPVAVRLTIDGPIIRNKLSFVLSTRYNYSSFIGSYWKDYSNAYSDNLNNNSTSINTDFYDIFGKLSFDLNSKNKFIYLINCSKEKLDRSNEGLIKSNNLVQKFQWNSVITKKLTVNNSLSYSNHLYSIEQVPNYYYTLNNGIKEIAFLSDVSYSYKSDNLLNFGISCVHNEIMPISLSSDENSYYIDYHPDTKKSITTSVYVSDQHTIAGFIRLNCGIRYNAFSTYGKDITYQYEDGNIAESNINGAIEYSNYEKINFFQSVEPRISAHFQLNKNNSLNLSYSFAKQYLHKLAISGIANMDVWYPSNQYLKPQSVNHYSIGYKYSINDGRIDFGTEPYLAFIKKVNELTDGSSIFLNPHIETEIAICSGKSYGAKFFIKKNEGRISGWVSYTLSKSILQSEQINKNEEFPSSYQRLHNIAIVLILKIKNNWFLSSNYSFISGGYTSFPSQQYSFNGNILVRYSDRNGQQLDNYSRTDISTTYIIEPEFKEWKGEISIGIYNIFNKKYSTSIYFSPEKNGFEKIVAGGFTPYLKLRFYF